ncbi:MAG: hypothetical protein ACRD0U_12125 [Acidimicrobiales bacterium]
MFVVVIPAIVFYANRVVRPVFEIKKYADDVLEHGVGLTGELDAVPKLVETRTLAAVARARVTRYGAALGRVL